MPEMKLNPDEQIIGLEGRTVLDFWAWAYSDLLVNTTRSVFAEFLVGAALDLIDKPRVEWNAVDFDYRGKKIEVKASAYVQSWPQKQLSAISFDIAPKKGWDAATNTYVASEPIRSADCYVFCLFAETDRQSANILDAGKWQFYVVLRERLEQLRYQKTIRLKTLEALCQPVAYNKLKETVDRILHFAP